MLKTLFVASEAHPLIKTGGLGDVAGALPLALQKSGADVRVVLPAYRKVLQQAGQLALVSNQIETVSPTVCILEGRLANTNIILWLVDAPALFDRSGEPYSNANGDDWPDNALRYATFSKVINAIANDRAKLNWRPDIVHCNDWQTGLVPALLSLEKHRPASIFTIHNMAYQGIFNWQQFNQLDLPNSLWSVDSMEYYDQISFLKGGIVHSDVVNTVSPRYAEEICTPEFGCGMEGILQQRRDRLSGILNGVDYEVWDPRKDSLISRQYDYATFRFKRQNKVALQKQMGLEVDPTIPMLGVIGRMVEQKGIDLIIDLLPKLSRQRVQFVGLGSGIKAYEEEMAQVVARNSAKFAYHIGYNEQLAHQIEAAADIFLMPSRFEPCGLNQIYSLRYGTAPIVRNTGGLADTVVDATQANLRTGQATGFVFNEAKPADFERAVTRALNLFQQPRMWKKMIKAGMAQNYSWDISANAYIDLCHKALKYRG
ncbi:MAG: glycogen synthase GlgA [Gammaproteobacteria bacterium]|nr:glycogen synthase GlgA [Gammaproteobacteria bacterium]